MKFYVSAKWNLHETVHGMVEQIRTQGHEVPVDWTERAFARDYAKFEASGEFAEEEVTAILDCDVLIHLSDLGGKGKYIDLGIALAGKKLQNKPSHIYIVGEKATESQFYFNKNVIRIVCKDPKDSLNQILAEVTTHSK